MKFLRPVYVGDELYIIGMVEELHESVQQAILKIEIKNQNDQKVLKGHLYVGFLER